MNKTKYLVLRLFDEVCSENNEVNEKVVSKRLERAERPLKYSQKTAVEILLRDC